MATKGNAIPFAKAMSCNRLLPEDLLNYGELGLSRQIVI